ncbi:methionyl-tRNA formyltransferase [Oceanotoga sp. DSM 15011]|uniref:Methionyl-tRNA formyltransferase n=1 Tax=Oceanotoga teriensis TaxID=515440 RepID=A0AA45HJG9_9BACT|nr:MULTISPECIES: methionyl-tRNA formyltransferase [Oceanotoga]MDN5341246.1 methionyl-tRNA formyltransferase [Oceanotoga sp.]PWJ96006.1 methionyl-tRNA formyltransferase [Oceanotoga teriensis]UYP00772.1 methionyl-tRNA formyltransferase [Oceanotoga sp. DSM 15011]
MKNKKIVFMGTPEFSSEILEYLLENNVNIIGVFSQEDKPKGRGRKIQPTPVKLIANKFNIPVFQPKSINIGEGFQKLKDLDPDMIITVAFGKILKNQVINLPKYGCWNVHTSLLPNYRGAAPMQRAIENGESETGISIFKIVRDLDAGPIACKKNIRIDLNDNLEDVYNSLLYTSKELLLNFLSNYENIKLEYQDDEKSSYAHKISPEDLKISFKNNVFDIHNKIRAYDPYPGVKAFINGESVKIFGSFLNQDYKNIKDIPGKILSSDESGISVSCKDGYLIIKNIQFPGKKKITSTDALNGHKIKIGDIFE